MIAAFLVFRKSGALPADGSPQDWSLYFTTTTADVREDNIKNEALQYGWRVVKVVLNDELEITGSVTL